jgi:hypothetical protein
MNIRKPPYISNSQLTAFKKSPAHWLHYLVEHREQTPAMLFGKVGHCLALQRDKFEEEFFYYDTRKRPEKDKNFTSTENKKWKKDQLLKAEGKILVDEETFDGATNAILSLCTDSVAKQYLKGEYETKLEWDSMGLHFLGIRDITSDDYIVDLKFVTNADPRAFQSYLFKEGVYRQGGMYLDGEMKGEFTGDPHKRMIFIAVENKAPYGVSVHELDYEVINAGVNEYRRLAEQLKSCIENEYFPSYHFRSINGSFDVTLPTFLPTE